MGNFSCLNQVDIALWSQSVLGAQNTDYQPPSSLGESEEDVTGHFADMNFSPDDTVSTASGMDNSTYSQVNPFRRMSRTGHGNPFSLSQHQGYLPPGMAHPGNAISPAVNSEGRGSSLVSSDRSQVPPGLISSATSDHTDNTFNTSDYANFNTGQDFGPVPHAEYSEQPFPRLPSQFSEVGMAQNAIAQNYQEFGKPFGGDSSNPAAFPQNFPLQHSQVRSGSVASFVGNDNGPAVHGQTFTRPPLIRQGSSQTFSIRSTNASEAANDFEFQMDNSQAVQFSRNASIADANQSLQAGSHFPQVGTYDNPVEGSHDYLQYSMYVFPSQGTTFALTGE